MFAVVRKFEEDVKQDMYYKPKASSFTVYHDTLEIAIDEATRLCKKEGKPFYVLKVVGLVEVTGFPTKYTEI